MRSRLFHSLTSKLLLGLLVIALPLSASALRAPQYSAVVIGQYTDWHASLNNHGAVLFNRLLPNNQYVSTIFYQNQFFDIPQLSNPGATFSTSINDHFEVVGQDIPRSYLPQAYYFDGRTAHLIPPTSARFYPSHISNGGITSGYLTGSQTSLAAIWHPSMGAPLDLNMIFTVPGGGALLDASQASDRATVAGTAVLSPGNYTQRGFLADLVTGSLTLLNPLPQQTVAYAYAVNSNNVVVGLSETPGFQLPTQWRVLPNQLPVATALTLPAQAYAGFARDINDQDVVVGDAWFPIPGQNHVIVWKGGLPIDLNNPGTVSNLPPNCTTDRGLAINESGQVLANSTCGQVLLTPIP